MGSYSILKNYGKRLFCSCSKKLFLLLNNIISVVHDIVLYNTKFEKLNLIQKLEDVNASNDVHTYTRTHARTHTQTHTRKHTQKHTHTHTHTHTHIIIIIIGCFPFGDTNRHKYHSVFIIY